MIAGHLVWAKRPRKKATRPVPRKPCHVTTILIGIVLPLIAVLGPAGPMDPPAPALAGNWRLTFHDEFNGTALDRTKWSTTFPWGARTNGGNHELEYYSDNAFQVADGILRIQADKRPAQGFHYTSGIITSYASFALTYGYIEIRAKVPKGKGLWPSVWLAPTDQTWPPEIDILEIRGDKTDTNLMTNHYLRTPPPTPTKIMGDRFLDVPKPAQINLHWTGPDFSQGFHTFGLEWSKGRLVWYIDGIERFQTSVGVPSQPMYLIANLAVGGDWSGSPDAVTPFPSYLDLAYIRVYQRP